MPWKVEFCPEFESEYNELAVDVRRTFLARVKELESLGPRLGRPYADTLKGSRFPNMKELRFSAHGEVWRFAYAFDPERKAVLLVGGDKASKDKRLFYRWLIQKADIRYQRHLDRLERG